MENPGIQLLLLMQPITSSKQNNTKNFKDQLIHHFEVKEASEISEQALALMRTEEPKKRPEE
jgi:hypothetical protein